MDHIQSVQDSLTGDPEQDAEFLTDVLQQVQQILMDNNTLSQKVMFNVKRKGSQDKARFRKLLNLLGPDPETLKLLEDWSALWIQNPGEFWRRPSPPILAHYDPQTQVVDGVDKLKDKMEEMVTIGSRYKNMEKELGLGVAFVLGTSVSESAWKKLLPKSGPKFTEVIDHAKKTTLPDLATRYSSLRIAVIETQLGVFRLSQA